RGGAGADPSCRRSGRRARARGSRPHRYTRGDGGDRRMSETKRLGRGLEALLGPISRQDAESSGALLELPVQSLRPNPYQPRARLDEPQFSELVASLETAGLLQPIVVRKHLDGYQLI